MTNQSPIEAARAWSEARGLEVEWRESFGDALCRVGPFGIGLAADDSDGWHASIMVESGGQLGVMSTGQGYTPTAALDAAAEQAARLCGALGRLVGNGGEE